MVVAVAAMHGKQGSLGNVYITTRAGPQRAPHVLCPFLQWILEILRVQLVMTHCAMRCEGRGDSDVHTWIQAWACRPSLPYWLRHTEWACDMGNPRCADKRVWPHAEYGCRTHHGV